MAQFTPNFEQWELPWQRPVGVWNTSQGREAASRHCSLVQEIDLLQESIPHIQEASVHSVGTHCGCRLANRAVPWRKQLCPMYFSLCEREGLRDWIRETIRISWHYLIYRYQLLKIRIRGDTFYTVIQVNLFALFYYWLMDITSALYYHVNTNLKFRSCSQ